MMCARLSFLVLIFCLSSAIAIDNGNKDISDIIPDLFESVVNIIDSSETASSFNEKKPPSLGTGFIISESGFIVTNHHVLGEIDSPGVKVELYDGTEFAAKIVGRDSRADIALLKIEAGRKLKFLKLADSDTVKVCEKVIAIGNPFGFGHTVTSGIISYKSRDISDNLTQFGGGDLVDYIQTDASINNGNSGGPLIRAGKKGMGEVVGMNTSMFSNSDYNSGINFSIPSNTIKSVVEQLREFGKMRRPSLGIKFDQIPSEVLNAFGLCRYSNAVVVTNVERDSSASRAGIIYNDIILSIDKQDLSHKNRASMIVSLLEVGKIIEIQIFRDERIIKLSLKVGFKDSDGNSERNISTELKKIHGIYIKELGMTVINITPELIGLLNLPYDQSGIIVSDINSVLCNQYDINIGDVIISINQKSLFSVDDLKNCIKNIKDRVKHTTVALFIKRDKANTYRVAPLRNVK